MTERTAATPVYSIAVAAQLTGLPLATLRLYEDKGILTPARTSGGTRRYSDHDVAVMRQVVALQEEGVNLTGIGKVLTLQNRNDTLQDQNDALLRQIAEGGTRGRTETDTTANTATRTAVEQPGQPSQ